MKKVILLSVLILLISLAYSFADVPCKINYQGRLIKDNVPVDGTKKMVFSIYNDAVAVTPPLWTSGEVDVTVYNGLFRYVLDLSSIDDWTAGEALYLEVQVETDILTPREELYAYPYAINSHLLEGATKEYFINTSGDTQKKDGGLNIMGDVGIGTAGPLTGAKLEVYGNGANTSLLVHEDAGTQEAGLWLRRGTQDWEINNVGRLDFVYEEAEKVTIDTNGNVGIGTTDPGEKLTVTGTIESTTGGVKFPDGTLQTTAPRAPTIEVINGSHDVQYTRNHSGYVKIQFNHVCRSDAGNLTIKFKVDGIVQKQFTVNTNYITIPSPTFVYYGQKSGNFTFKLDVSQSGGAYSAKYTQFIVTKY